MPSDEEIRAVTTKIEEIARKVAEFYCEAKLASLVENQHRLETYCRRLEERISNLEKNRYRP